MTRPLWSILMATHASRHQRFGLLARSLCSQAADWHQLAPPGVPGVEIAGLYNHGGRPVGEYRQALLNAARGQWVSFVDDDDWVDPDFVDTIALILTGRGPDVVSFDVDYTEVGGPSQWQRCVLDVTAGWREDGATMYRDLTVVQPIRAELARLGEFDGWPEDRAWRQGVLDRLAETGDSLSQVRADRVLYYYRHNWADSVQASGGLRLGPGDLDRPRPALDAESRWFRWIEAPGG